MVGNPPPQKKKEIHEFHGRDVTFMTAPKSNNDGQKLMNRLTAREVGT